MQADGERLPLAVKDLGSCDLYPQSLQHNGNGRFVAVCGDGEYIVYTALAWRNKSFGSALDVVWGDDSSTYAIRCCPPCMPLLDTQQMAGLLPSNVTRPVVTLAQCCLREDRARAFSRQQDRGQHSAPVLGGYTRQDYPQ